MSEEQWQLYRLQTLRESVQHLSKQHQAAEAATSDGRLQFCSFSWSELFSVVFVRLYRTELKGRYSPIATFRQVVVGSSGVTLHSSSLGKKHKSYEHRTQQLKITHLYPVPNVWCHWWSSKFDTQLFHHSLFCARDFCLPDVQLAGKEEHSCSDVRGVVGMMQRWWCCLTSRKNTQPQANQTNR